MVSEVGYNSGLINNVVVKVFYFLECGLCVPPSRLQQLRPDHQRPGKVGPDRRMQLAQEEILERILSEDVSNIVGNNLARQLLISTQINYPILCNPERKRFKVSVYVYMGLLMQGRLRMQAFLAKNCAFSECKFTIIITAVVSFVYNLPPIRLI